MSREQLISKFEELEKHDGWNTLFQVIEDASCNQELKLKLSTNVACLWNNMEKNRYRNVLAYDASRLVLKNAVDEKSDYINASIVTMESAKRNYILTQGPLQNTSDDFWQMVWEQKCKIIVMLNKLIEKGSSKCHNYFPTKDYSLCEFDSFSVRLIEEENCEHYVVRELEISRKSDDVSRDGDHSDEPFRLKHFQFISWPDFGVPRNSSLFIEFLDRVRGTGLLNEVTPAIVHCSAGIGRSGTFVVADSVLSMIEKNVEDINFIEIVLKMRSHRMGLIQTPQQLQFCWKTIVDALMQENNYSQFKSNNNLATTVDECTYKSETITATETGGKGIESIKNDSSGIRKRVSSEAVETDTNAKYAKRKERIEQMRDCLRKSERDRLNRNWMIGRKGVGLTCLAAAVAFVAYFTYRLSSS